MDNEVMRDVLNDIDEYCDKIFESIKHICEAIDSNRFTPLNLAEFEHIQFINIDSRIEGMSSFATDIKSKLKDDISRLTDVYIPNK